MKPHTSKVPSVLLTLFLVGATAHAQAITGIPREQNPDAVGELRQLLGGIVVQLQQGAGGRGVPGGTLRAPAAATAPSGGAWWTNAAVIQRLGLTDDQKARIERAFENYRQRIVSSTDLLEKEEAQLARLLEAETIDRSAVFTQIDRVTQARSEMEKANSAMTLEMREQLTRAQWMQLQAPPRVRVGANVAAANLISQPEPVAPAGVQGAVVLEVEISKEGTVESVKVISGDPSLTQAALNAVRQWRYKPILLNGEPVLTITTVTVNFPFSAGGRGERGAAPSPSAPGQRRGRQ